MFDERTRTSQKNGDEIWVDVGGHGPFVRG